MFAYCFNILDHHASTNLASITKWNGLQRLNFVIFFFATLCKKTACNGQTQGFVDNVSTRR